MIAEHRHLVEQGAELIELRLDFIQGEVNLRRLLADRPGPVVVTCRRSTEGGRFQGTEEQRLMLLRTAIADGCDYVDLEEDAAAVIPRFGKTRRIVSHHDFRKTPDDLQAIYQRLRKLDPDIIKICTMANHPQDNLRVLRLIGEADVPTVAFCMGDIGIPSRILAGRFGSPFTYATAQEDRALAPGQLSFEQMTQTYHYDRITAATEVYGVIADPVGHSLSPLIHNAGFAQLELDKVYLPLRIPKEDLATFLDQAAELGIRGLSVTIPHKENVIPKLTDVDPSVEGIGACNTVVFRDGRRYGYNTDYRASMTSLEEAILESPAPGEDQLDESPLRGKMALVLGSGGVGKAIAYGLVRRGARVAVTDGVLARAEQLADRLGCRAVEWSKRHSTSVDVLVNCTPIGMHPEVDNTPYEKHFLRPSMVVFDAVYNPENTLFIKNARAQNCKVVTGVDMFVRQACLQFELFTGHPGPADLMRDLLKRAIGAAKY